MPSTRPRRSATRQPRPIRTNGPVVAQVHGVQRSAGQRVVSRRPWYLGPLEGEGHGEDGRPVGGPQVLPSAHRTTMPAAAIQSAAMIQAPVAAAATPKAQTTGEPLSDPLRDSPATGSARRGQDRHRRRLKRSMARSGSLSRPPWLRPRCVDGPGSRMRPQVLPWPPRRNTFPPAPGTRGPRRGSRAGAPAPARASGRAPPRRLPRTPRPSGRA